MHVFQYKGGSGASTDPHFASVVAVSNFESTVAQDDIGNTFVTNSNVSLSSDQSLYGTNSAFFDNGYLALTPDANYAYGTGDFTFEVWVYLLAASDTPILETRTGGVTTDGYTLTGFSPTVVRTYTNTLGHVANLPSSILNKWTHIAVTRISGYSYFFVDGIEYSQGGSLHNNSSTELILGGGRYGSTGVTTITHTMSGYIDGFRLTNGVGRYNANFTPPTGPFPTS